MGKNKINILLPVYNEERRLLNGLSNLCDYMENNFADRYMLTILDNGSVDATQKMAEQFCSQYPVARYYKVPGKGVGLALQHGFRLNKLDVVGYLDIDLSTKLNYLDEVMAIFDSEPTVDIVNGSRNSKASKVIGRKKIRTITSYGLNTLLKIVFSTHIDDAMCGFKFFRKSVAEQLLSITSRRSGWFYCAELLLQAEKHSYNIREIPITWQDDYDSKVDVVKLSSNYLINIYHLYKEMKR